MSKKGKIIIGICIAVVVVCAAYLIIHFVGLQATSDKDKALSNEVVQENNDDSDSTVEITKCPVDFEELQEINPEIYAWLNVSNTEIDFPVVQHEGESGTVTDQYYYLNIGYDLKKSKYGTLFTTIENKKDMSDNATVIYGHNKSKFSQLKNYRDESYWDGRRTMIVYTPEKAFTYKVWASVIWDNSFLIPSYNLQTKEGFEAFINKVKATTNLNSHVDESMDVTKDDRLLILSTCVPENVKKRYLLIGVLQDETEYKE